MSTVELIRIRSGHSTDADWTLGPRRRVDATVRAVDAALKESVAEAVLCLDEHFPLPASRRLERLLDGPCDAWHAGLRLGLCSEPRALSHVQPQWMLTTPADPGHELTSPLLSLRALLVRRTVIDQLGALDPAMESLTGAGLEMGIRWTRAGAIVRHVPDLAPSDAEQCPSPPESDGHRCVARHFGHSWAIWALGRAVLQRRVAPVAVPRLLWTIRRTERDGTAFYRAPPRPEGSTDRRVSVILPTIDRYPYLEPLLSQLAAQTVQPYEVIIVDQTPQSHRRDDLSAVAPLLPLTVHSLEQPGQSTARNLAIRQSTGEFLLFIDDDDEIDPDIIENHLRLLADGVDAVSGSVDDATAGPPPPGYRHRRASDGFPTNNTMLRRAALRRSGLFDPTFDRGPRADHDLGTRLYLSGANLVYDPSVMVFHHHAPMGGLRTHGARAVTRASARRSLAERNLPSPTELYLGLRYYTEEQRKEAKAIRIVSIISGEGSRRRRALRAVTQLILLSDTLRRIRVGEQQARVFYVDRPPLPALDDATQ